jgi:hypothetical protein
VSKELSENRKSEHRHVIGSTEPPGTRPGGLIPRIISAEANLLRLPLFALDTKGLRTLDGIQCSSKVKRNGEIYQFTFRATRNTDTLYPGPLARSAHLAFLSIIIEAGFPFENPLVWTWRDLCRRIGIRNSGRTQQHLEAAVTATAGLLLKSESALYSKPDGKPIRTEKALLHLYEKVVFVGEELADGRKADTNHLWLSDWYLANLNAFFTAPLDYELWQSLDQRSTIASRLYEFLLLNFYSGTPVLRINYPNLAQFLPVRLEKYLSAARRQLSPAFDLLIGAEAVQRVRWVPHPSHVAQLHIHRGELLTPERDRNQAVFPFMEEEFTGEIEVKELRNVRPPEWTLVSDFYRLWADERFPRPTPKELAQAKGLIEEHGEKKAKALIPLVIERMRKRWPEAKTFGAVEKYVPEASGAYDAEQSRAAQRKRAREQQAQQQLQQAAEQTERDKLKAEWLALPEAERQEIGETVRVRSAPIEVTGYFFESLCLTELKRRATEPDQQTREVESPR